MLTFALYRVESTGQVAYAYSLSHSALEISRALQLRESSDAPASIPRSIQTLLCIHIHACMTGNRMAYKRAEGTSFKRSQPRSNRFQ